MRIIVMPSSKPYPVGYAAYSGAQDWAVTGNPQTWPTGQVSMGTGLGGNRIQNNNLIWDFQAEVWLSPGKSGGGGESFVRSTDAVGTSWVSWSAQKPPSPFTELGYLIYDFYHGRLIALDIAGRVFHAPTYTGPWTNTGVTIFPTFQISRGDVGWVGGQTVIVLGSIGGTRYSLDGGDTWLNPGGPGGLKNIGGGICFNAHTDTWFGWESTGEINETATNDISAGFVYTGNTQNYGNQGNLVCNPDTGTIIGLNLNSFRTWYRRDGGTGVWTNVTSGNGLPLASVESLIYDRTTSQWILGVDGGIWTSFNDGLTFAQRNGGQKINDGSQFFNTTLQLGYAQRYLQPHIVP